MERKEKLKLKHRSSRRVVASFVVCAWLFGGCASPVLDPVPVREPAQGTRLQLQVEEPDTKVEVADATGKCTWTPSATMPDTIAVWVSGSDNKYEDCIVNKDDISSSGTVGSVVLQSDQPRSRYAVYPASAAVSAASGSDDGSVNPQVSYNTHYDLSQLEASLVNDYTRLPMVAKNSDNTTPTLAFFHVGGMLRLGLKGIPSGATVVEVSFEGMDHVTGTYEVLEGGTVGGRTKGAPVSGKGNRVLFTLPSASVSSGSCVVNVPLPCGDYGTLTGVRVKAGTQERVKYAAWPFITHAMGKKLECDFNTPVGPIDRLVLGTGPDATLWKGQKVTRQARAYDAQGNEVSGVSVAWSSGNTAVATVNPSTGEVTAASAGQAVITATASGKTASYTVYVNEILSVELSRTSLSVREGQRAPLTAEVEYTRNGDWSTPEVKWTSSNTAVAAPSHAMTLSGERNTVSGLSRGTATITAGFDASVYGTGTPSATCAVTVSPGSPAYLPGKFTVSEGKSVYFAKGNVQFTATYNGLTAPTDGVWSFAEHQWDVAPIPYGGYTTGTTVTIDSFGWATAANGASDEHHQRFNPDPWGPFSSSYGPKLNGFLPDATWSTDNIPATLVIGNTWRGSSVEKFCEWGIHFDDNGNDAGDVSGKTSASWYTLSAYEWDYLFNKRPLAQMLVSYATIYFLNTPDPNINTFKTVRGLLIVPDDWITPAECTFRPFGIYGVYADGNDRFMRNQYFHGHGNAIAGDGRWEDMEAAGAVFLPCNWQNTASAVSYNLYYWTSSNLFSDNYAYAVTGAKDSDLRISTGIGVGTRLQVRLVHD